MASLSAAGYQCLTVVPIGSQVAANVNTVRLVVIVKCQILNPKLLLHTTLRYPISSGHSLHYLHALHFYKSYQ